MRKHYLKKLKETFCKDVVSSRLKLNLTIEQMAGRLAMDPRSYIDIDHGKSSCSALTLALYLIYCCPDVEHFLKQLQAEFEQEIGAA